MRLEVNSLFYKITSKWLTVPFLMNCHFITASDLVYITCSQLTALREECEVWQLQGMIPYPICTSLNWRPHYYTFRGPIQKDLMLLWWLVIELVRGTRFIHHPALWLEAKFDATNNTKLCQIRACCVDIFIYLFFKSIFMTLISIPWMPQKLPVNSTKEWST